jgi:amino acid transporter
MNGAQREWQHQLERSFGPREFIRAGGAIFAWNLLGAAVSLVVGSSVPVVLFMVALLPFALVATTWKPAYWVVRKVLGNPNMPAEPRPRAREPSRPERLPWWGYLPGLWFLLISLVIYYLAYKYISR